MSCTEHKLLSRRQALFAGASLALWASIPRLASAAGTRDPRLLTVILRGALDGLALAAPVADPDFERSRGKLALPVTGPGAGLELDGFFALNPAMPYLHELYRKHEALIVHAVATPYRDRSHFDGQDVLESGLPGVALSEDGWLNRALSAMAAGGRADPRGLAMSPIVPLVMRGRAPVLSWTPPAYGAPLREDTIRRLMDLYAETDPDLGHAFSTGIAIDHVAGPHGTPPATPAVAMAPQPAAAPQPPSLPPGIAREFVDTAATAARFMAPHDGPRIGALSYNGWDTHANEGALQGQLYNRLAGLDAAIKAFADGMGPAWRDTVMVIVTEFGRTARINGTEGTDHGTGTVALLVGGAVKGGRVHADWPGLSEAALYQKRDLAPTTDLRAVLKAVLQDHLGVPAGALAATVFPNSASVRPLGGLIA